MEKEQIHVPSTNSSVRVLTKKQDDLSLQYIIELPNRKRNIISLRVIIVFGAMLSMIWFRKCAFIVVSGQLISTIILSYLSFSLRLSYLISAYLYNWDFFVEIEKLHELISNSSKWQWFVSILNIFLWIYDVHKVYKRASWNSQTYKLSHFEVKYFIIPAC